MLLELLWITFSCINSTVYKVYLLSFLLSIHHWDNFRLLNSSFWNKGVSYFRMFVWSSKLFGGEFMFPSNTMLNLLFFPPFLSSHFSVGYFWDDFSALDFLWWTRILRKSKVSFATLCDSWKSIFQNSNQSFQRRGARQAIDLSWGDVWASRC